MNYKINLGHIIISLSILAGSIIQAIIISSQIWRAALLLGDYLSVLPIMV